MCCSWTETLLLLLLLTLLLQVPKNINSEQTETLAQFCSCTLTSLAGMNMKKRENMLQSYLFKEYDLQRKPFESFKFQSSGV